MRIFWIKPRNIILIILTITILIIGVKYGINYVEKTMYPIEHDEYIEKYSERFELDPWLVLAVIWVESKFDNTATSSKDARGLMQITPQTGQWASEKLKLEDYEDELLYDPETNIKIGSWYLDNLRTQFDGNFELVLAAYNGGSGNVTEWLGNKEYSDDGKTLKKIPFEETENYVMRVFKTYDKYRELYENDDSISFN